jgi:DNA-binding NarL/FixJ family response regulator
MGDDEHVLAALAAGVDAYVLKGSTLQLLFHAINSVALGALWFDPAIAKRMIMGDASSRRRTDVAAPKLGLTARELEVLNLLCQGSTNLEIASALWISTETVKTHVRHLMEKIGVNKRTELAVKAIRMGLSVVAS